MKHLKDCPFCGYYGTWIKGLEIGNLSAHVTCSNMDCFMFEKECTGNQWNTRTPQTSEREKKLVVEMTIEQLSADIQTWRFSSDYEHDHTFGKYLLIKYPNGIKIIGD